MLLKTIFCIPFLCAILSIPGICCIKRTNTIIGTMEYPDFPFPKGLRSFPSATCINKYLQSYTSHFELRKYIQFQSLVTNVLWTEDKWNVTYMRTDTRKNASEECDFVVVASGQYSAPRIPHFKYQEEFKGKIIHSIDYKDSEHFRDQRVLVVGAGPSGLDVVAQLINVTSILLHSHHFKYELPKVPGSYVKKPNIKHFTQTVLSLLHNSTEEFDIVILCTELDDRSGVMVGLEPTIRRFKKIQKMK